MNGHQRVSVVIPTLNEEAYLPATLRGLRHQTLQPMEVLVADAGSGDRTTALAMGFGCRVVPGGLPAVGRNHGAALATGEWLLFLDADVTLPANALQKALETADREQLDGLSCAFAPDRKTPVLRATHWLSCQYFHWATKLRWAHSIGGFLLVKKTVHDRIGGFDTTILVAEDQDYVRRIQKTGRYAFVLDPVVEISTRRFKDDGVIRANLRWLGIELHRLCVGEVRRPLFRYF